MKILCKEWGDLLILRPIPIRGDPWGVLRCLEETVWGDQIAVVPGDVFSTALHGHAMPLVRVLGNPPEVRSRRIPVEDGICRLRTVKTCGFSTPECKPGPKLPMCYEAPGNIDVSLYATAVAQAWKEKRYVVVVEGDEFS